jgi:hypothetical protein
MRLMRNCDALSRAVSARGWSQNRMKSQQLRVPSGQDFRESTAYILEANGRWVQTAVRTRGINSNGTLYGTIGTQRRRARAMSFSSRAGEVCRSSVATGRQAANISADKHQQTLTDLDFLGTTKQSTMALRLPTRMLGGSQRFTTRG